MKIKELDERIMKAEHQERKEQLKREINAYITKIEYHKQQALLYEFKYNKAREELLELQNNEE